MRVLSARAGVSTPGEAAGKGHPKKGRSRKEQYMGIWQKGDEGAVG